MLNDDQRTSGQNFVKDVILCQLIYKENSGQRFVKDVKDRPKGKSATLCERRHMTILLSKSATLCKRGHMTILISKSATFCNRRHMTILISKWATLCEIRHTTIPIAKWIAQKKKKKAINSYRLIHNY